VCQAFVKTPTARASFRLLQNEKQGKILTEAARLRKYSPEISRIAQDIFWLASRATKIAYN
jgi:hypothetical protein